MAGESSHGGRDSNDPSRRTSSASDADADNLMTQVLNSKSEEYRLLFRLPQSDALVQDFNCALLDNFLIQGHMYLFTHHICFYSNIFGFETKRTIAFHEITAVRKAKTAGIFHNAIEITVGEKKHFFGSFLSRDEAHRLIEEGCSQHSHEPKKFLDPQDSKDDNCCDQENNIDTLESADDSRQLADINFTESLPDGFTENLANGMETADNASHRVPSIWQLEDVDAPKVPEHFTLISEAKFPVSVENFFHYFFSDSAIEFVQTFRKNCGDMGFKCDRWRRHEQFGHVRDLSFDHPVKILFGPKSGHCQERQKFRAYRDRHLVIETSQQISDVPFGDHFHVQGLWDVEQDDAEESTCHLKVYINVAFSRKLLWKGKIEQSTHDECRDVYRTWIKNANELLEQKLREKEQDIPSCSEREDSDTGLPKLEESSEYSLAIKPSKRMHVALDFRDLCTQICGPIQEALRLSTCVVSIFKESCASFFKYLKRQPNPHLTLAVAFAVLSFLMQLIIIFLLSKSPTIHVVSQGSYINSLGGERSESIRWLEERVHNLNQEMQLMEGRLERMRHEYTFLRTHLQDLHMLRTES